MYEDRMTRLKNFSSDTGKIRIIAACLRYYAVIIERSLPMMELIEQLKLFVPYNEQERKDCAQIETLLRTVPNLYTRENPCFHLTASAWVVNQNHQKVLMAYHNIYQSWSWLGGHADGDRNLLHTAMREVQEESGLQNLTPVSDQIYSVEILSVDGHEKKGAYIPSHLHLNITYLLQADEKEPLQKKPDENSAVSWFSLEDAVRASTEEWFQKRIYSKLNSKLSDFF